MIPLPMSVKLGQPAIVSFHSMPCLVYDSKCVTSQSQQQIATETRATLNGLAGLMQNGLPFIDVQPGNLSFAIVTLETHSNTANEQKMSPAVDCDDNPVAAPAGLVDGFNASNLAGRVLSDLSPGVIFRPWHYDGGTGCHGWQFPQPLSPPYKPKAQ
jgi:hypothetical protein